jgi:hypothetical protein
MRKARFLLTNEKAVGLIIAVVAFVIYLLTLAPTVGFIDSGELAAVATTLGIAHPTGYPFFTLIGWLFTRLPIGGSEIYKLNLMSALFCSIGTFVFYKMLVFLAGLSSRQFSKVGTRDSVGMQRKDKTKGKDKSRGMSKTERLGKSEILIGASVGTIALAFSNTYWCQAVGVEVYSLHCLLVVTILYLFLKAVSSAGLAASVSRGLDSSKDRKRPRFWQWLQGERYWLFFALTLGLSFANHLTTILLALGFLYLFFATQGINKTAFRRIVLMAAPFLLGLSLYLYLPIRAGQDPSLNWGNPTTLERFLWHLSGKQYRVWFFESTEAAVKQFSYFIQALPKEFAYLALLLVIAGIWKLLRLHRKLFYFTLLLFLACVGYSINYDIHDIDSYFLLAYITTAIWIGLGAVQLAPIFKPTSVRSLVAAILLLSVLITPVMNYSAVNESKNYLVEDYTMNLFGSIEPNGIILTYQWDYFVSSSLYFQTVEKRRQDIIVIDKELLRRSWYFNQLRTSYPWLVEKSQNEIDAFLRELYKFEHDLPYDANVIEARYVGMINSFIDRNIGTRPIYVMPEIEGQFGSKYQRVPEGLAFRLYNDNLYHEVARIDLRFRDDKRTGRLINGIKGMYPSMLTNRGIYDAQHGMVREASTYFDRALKLDPSNSEARRWKQRLGLP